MPTNVGGRGIATGIDDRGTNGDGQFRHVLSSSVSTSAATFPMGEGLDRAILNCSKITTALRWLRKSCCLSEQRTPRALPTATLKPRLRGAARRAHGSSARPKSTSSGDASHLRQGGARHARLNRVKCTVAERFAQSTSEWPKTLPRGSNGAAAPWHAFLPYLSSCNERWGARRKCPWGATGGRKISREVRKNVTPKDEV